MCNGCDFVDEDGDCWKNDDVECPKNKENQADQDIEAHDYGCLFV